MKSFRLTLSSRDKKLIMRLAYLAYRLRMRRLAMWLYMKVPPFGTLIAATMGIEIMMLRIMKSVVVEKNDTSDA